MVRFGPNIKDLLFTCYLGKTRSNLGKNFLHPKKYALTYIYGLTTQILVATHYLRTPALNKLAHV